MYDEEYIEQKMLYERKLERLLDDKRKQLRNLEDTIDFQKDLVTLFDKMSMEDPNLQYEGDFAECYDAIKKSSNDIIEASSEKYMDICNRCDEAEENLFEFNQKHLSKEYETTQDVADDEE